MRAACLSLQRLKMEPSEGCLLTCLAAAACCQLQASVPLHVVSAGGLVWAISLNMVAGSPD